MSEPKPSTDASPSEAPRQLPYGRQWIDDDDIAAVVEALRSDWLTQGPRIEEFERAVAARCGARYAVAVSSGTAALHAACFAAALGPGDEAVVPPLSFAATANCVLYQGATPVFADVREDLPTLDPGEVERRLTPRTRAVIPVDYGGHPAELDAILALARRRRLAVIEDAAHALGAVYQGRPVGSLADMTVLSFHPVKHITTGEGGMVLTDDEDLRSRLMLFRTHGITRQPDQLERPDEGSWYYEMQALGFNYRITDIQCALGVAQLRKLEWFLERRRAIARQYDANLDGLHGIRTLRKRAGCESAYHLYPIRVPADGAGVSRRQVFDALRSAGLGVNVHYIPIHLHPYYRRRFGTGPGLCPRAERFYEEAISLPLHPGMDDRDVARVIEAVATATAGKADAS